MRDKVPVMLYIDREMASAFQKKYPRSASELMRRCIEHALRHNNFMHDILYCDYDDDNHCFKEFY